MGYKLTREMCKRKLPPNQKTVWKAMGDHAHDADGTNCYVSQETLAWETGYTVRQIGTIQRGLSKPNPITGLCAIVESRKPGNGYSRHFLINLEAVPIDPRSTRPEIFSGQVAKTGEHTGNVFRSDRKSLQPDRKSTATRPEKISYKPSENPSLNPKETLKPARARESRVIDVDITEGLRTAAIGVDRYIAKELRILASDSEAGKKEIPIFRRGVDNVSAKSASIRNSETEAKRAQRKRELAEQLRIIENNAKAEA